MEIQKKSHKKGGKIENSTHMKGSATGDFYKVKHYSCEEIGSLPYVFIDDEAVIILQTVAKI